MLFDSDLPAPFGLQRSTWSLNALTWYGTSRVTVLPHLEWNTLHFGLFVYRWVPRSSSSSLSVKRLSLTGSGLLPFAAASLVRLAESVDLLAPAVLERPALGALLAVRGRFLSLFESDILASWSSRPEAGRFAGAVDGVIAGEFSLCTEGASIDIGDDGTGEEGGGMERTVGDEVMRGEEGGPSMLREGNVGGDLGADVEPVVGVLGA